MYCSGAAWLQSAVSIRDQESVGPVCSTSAVPVTSSDSRLKHSFWDIFGKNLHILKRSFKAVSVAMATLCSVSA